MSVREMNKKKKRLNGKEIYKVTWRFRKSVLMRPIPAICANLAVFAIGENILDPCIVTHPRKGLSRGI